MKRWSTSGGEFEAVTVPWMELRQLQRCPLSGGRLARILDFFISALVGGMKMAAHATAAEWKLIDCYLESNLLLLDACDAILRKVQCIRSELCSLDIALHYLDGEHDPGRTVLSRAVAALESCDFKDNQHCAKLEQCFSSLRTMGKKMDCLEAGGDGSRFTRREFYMALNGSWKMAVLAIGVLGTATCIPRIQFPKAGNSWAILRAKASRRLKKGREYDSSATMEELTDTAIAAETVLKLASGWQKRWSSVTIRPLELKAAAGELRRRREALEEALQPLEEKIRELRRRLFLLRTSVMGSVSSAQREGEAKLACRPGAGCTGLQKSMLRLCVAWVWSRNRRPFLSQVGRIGSFLGLIWQRR